MEFKAVIDVYRSQFEKSVVLIDRVKDRFNLWVISSTRKPNEILSFDSLKDEELARKMLKWYREMETRKISITNALAYLEGQDAANRPALPAGKKD